MVGSRAAGTVALLVLAGAASAVPAYGAPTSTTTLVLSTVQSAYGQTVTASAHVDTPGGPAEGDVTFTIDGSVIKANLRADGSASAVLPRALVGEHPVSATFAPQFPDRQASSASPTVTWVVSQVRTRLQVRVTGRGARIPTSVVVTAAGEYGTRPTGPVTVTVRHLGTGTITPRERTLDTTGAALARFGILRTGTYRLRVTYAGDGQHLAERHSEKFAVRQR
ncbi:Ig-like domain-containing protein [Nocardioides zhouii]|uniref:Ig-like domain repeat protein n=1 Tax=Nocardioides zhouii TaxID=1168729 RepID=A0A4Q2T6Z1_9ACTN|nr:Ig-like domain-containing protein [Nocardioides zhouii]RYC14665.1 Ig-like domain repeat protein [Nocardioides zhouii]